MARSDFDIELLRQCMHYDENTGILTWKVSRGKAKSGKTVGRIGREGYVKLCLFGRYYVAHRVIWAMHYGCQPPEVIDHINQNRSDNRICNLRDGTCAINQQNQQRPHCRNKSSKYLGVSKFSGRWRAKIYNKGKYYFLGYFASEEDAAQAYILAKRKLHDGCEL